MFLVLGSCRVTITLSRSKYQCLNTWKKISGRNNNSNKIIGRGWTINEHYEMIKLILGDKKPDNYIGNEYDYSSIEENILYIKNHWDDIKGIIIEPSSIKYYTDKNNKLIHNVHHAKNNLSEYKLNILSEDEIDFYLKKIMELLPDKYIIFVNHFLHRNLPNRNLINKCLNKICNDNVIVITPSNLWNNETKFNYVDRGEYHYRRDKINDICIYVDNMIGMHFDI